MNSEGGREGGDDNDDTGMMSKDGIGGDKDNDKGYENHPSLTRTSATGAPTTTALTPQTTIKPTLPSSCIAAYSGQDLCVMRDNAQKWSKLEPKVAVDGVKCFVCSVLQALMFVLFDSGRGLAICCRLLLTDVIISLFYVVTLPSHHDNPHPFLPPHPSISPAILQACWGSFA